MFDFRLRDSSPARRGRAIALLLGGAALGQPGVAVAATASGAAAAAAQPVPDEIIIYAPQAFRDLRPERQLDEQSIAGYGVSTVDDLLGELADELGEDEEPLIFVNGERVTADDIAGLPVETLRNVQVLPRGSAVRAGGRSGQRVVSLTLTRRKRSVTMTVAPKIASEGDWSAGRGEAQFTHVNGATRANVSFRSRGESGLLDSDRDIIQPAPRLPYAIGGNVIAFPSPTGEIDPALSAAAGQIVTVAPIPGTASPGLADFAAGANHAATTDVGEFRNLRPRTRNHEFNGSYSTRIAPWLTSTASLRLARNESRSRRGLPSAQFILSDDNPASPFSRDVSLVLYGDDPLVSSSKRDSGDANLTFNGTLAKWTGNLNLRHSESRDISRSQRAAQFGAIPIADDVNPFTAGLADRIAIRDDKATGRSVLNQAQLNLNGPVIELPAGEVEATIEGRLAWSSQRSRSTFATINPSGSFRRSEQSMRGALDIPLTSSDAVSLPQIGDLDATVEYGLMHFSDAGTLNYYSGGLTWVPRPFVRFRAALEKTDRPPSVQLLGNPVFLAPDIRSFDPLTGETVDVVQITGGNPLLRPETTKVTRLASLFTLAPSLNLQLNVEYTDTDVRDLISSLPEASAAVTQAFPDRFIRDSNGVLTTIDLRPVNFDSQRQKRLRYGISLNTSLGGGSEAPVRVAVTPGDDADNAADSAPPPRPRLGDSRRGTRLQLSANHSIVFSDEIRIRSGLDPVDLLGGGAIGIAGGRTRHQFDGTAALNRGSTGVRLGVTWRGPSTLESRISGTTERLRFSPLLLVNLRAFTDAGQLFGGSSFARGTRLSLNVLNLTNDRQSVRDPRHDTPLQYQSGYRDPIGRTIEFEIRRAF